LMAFLVTGIKFGLPGLSMPVSSAIRGAELVPHQLSIGTTILLFALIQALGAAFLSVVCCFISLYNRKSLASISICMGFTGISYGYGFLVNSSTFTPEMFRVPNIFSFLESGSYLLKYNITVITGLIIPWIWIYIVVWLIISGTLVFKGIKKEGRVEQSVA